MSALEDHGNIELGVAWEGIDTRGLVNSLKPFDVLVHRVEVVLGHVAFTESAMRR